MFVTDVTIRVKTKDSIGFSGSIDQIFEIFKNEEHEKSVKSFEFVDGETSEERLERQNEKLVTILQKHLTNMNSFRHCEKKLKEETEKLLSKL